MSDSLSLNDLLKSVMHAAMDANNELHNHERRSLYNHLKYNNQDNTLEPTTVTMKLPQKHINAGEDPEQPVEVPTAVLASYKSMAIEELSVDFSCAIQSINNFGSGQKKIMVNLNDTGVDATNKSIKINLKIKSGHPSEGLSKIHDALNKKLD